MDAATAAEVEDWPEVPFSGGYMGLHDLADQEFTGAVEAEAGTLYLLNGRVVGIEGGTIEDFEAGGTAREAPHEGLPLLYAMQTRETAEVRGRYYTEETPVEEVDRTLQEGGFTGYLELSENVLSGDYFVLYQAGKSMRVAFIGNARRVLTDEEAFERTCDEVGIYEVKAVDLDVIDVPHEPDTGAAGETARPADGDVAEADDRAPAGDVTEAGDRALADELAEGGDRAPADELAEGGDRAPAGDAPGDAAGQGIDESNGDAPTVDALGEVGAGTVEGRPDPPGLRRSEPSGLEGGEAVESVPETDLDPVRDKLAERENELENVRTMLAATREERDRLATTVERLKARIDDIEGEGGTDPDSDSDPDADSTPDSETEGPELSVADSLSETNMFVRYDSKSRPTLEDTLDGGVDPGEVRDNLRIEYHTQFEDEHATVEGTEFTTWLHDRAEYRFLRWLTAELPFEIRATGSASSMRKLFRALPDLDRVALDEPVQGGPEEGRRGRAGARGDGDIDTGTEGSDRSAGRGDESPPGDSGEYFDLVAYNRMGRPLVVADLETSRTPVTEDAMASLVQAATDLARTENHLAGAFFVTESYFEPSALSIAEDATGGSLLSRDTRESFVKLSRNRGFHLCLVEDREGSFHLTVPQL